MGSDFAIQMVNYFKNVTEIEHMGYYFEPGKWYPDEKQLKKLLNDYQNLFDTDDVSWAHYQQLFDFDDLEIKDHSVTKLIDHIVDNFYNKIIYNNSSEEKSLKK